MKIITCLIFISLKGLILLTTYTQLSLTKHSVLLVDKRSYDAWSIDMFSDDNTVFIFTRFGPYYFVRGNEDNCNRIEKLIAMVMAE